MSSKEQMAARRKADPDGVREYQRKWHSEHREQVRIKAAERRRVRVADPEYRKKKKEQQGRWLEKNRVHHTQYMREYYLKNREKYLARSRLKTVGVTPEQYALMLAAQRGRCAICRKKPKPGDRQLAADHDHATGKVRKLLCRGCNVGLGHLRDDPKLLERAAAYVREHAQSAT